MDIVQRTVRRAGLSQVAIEADSVTLSLRNQLLQALPKCELVEISGWVQRLREIKDRQEVEAIRRSLSVAERAFAVVKASLRGEQTERELAFALEHQIRLFGGESCSFRPIVAVGPRAALPHAVPTSARLDSGDFVLLDWGAKVGGYLSDLTRVLVTAKISPKLERIYGVVIKAQQQAIAAVRDGAVMSDVDAAARGVIAAAGFDRRFGHGLGHGFGLEIHESPRLAPLQDRKLRAGMVITIEPGIYLPGFGGVRIEDDILVTRSGHEVLSHVPKTLDECTVRWTD
jgi:Xaa-Pro aminopeptidase